MEKDTAIKEFIQWINEFEKEIEIGNKRWGMNCAIDIQFESVIKDGTPYYAVLFGVKERTC